MAAVHVPMISIGKLVVQKSLVSQQLKYSHARSRGKAPVLLLDKINTMKMHRKDIRDVPVFPQVHVLF